MIRKHTIWVSSEAPIITTQVCWQFSWLVVLGRQPIGYQTAIADCEKGDVVWSWLLLVIYGLTVGFLDNQILNEVLDNR